MGKIWVYFHLRTSETAFLVRNLPIDPCNLSIFHNRQGHSFFLNFQKRAEEISPFSLVVFVCWHILRFLCLLPKNSPEISRKYGSYLGWRVKYSEPRKTSFINEIMEV